jgi:hypothetical protein
MHVPEAAELVNRHVAISAHRTGAAAARMGDLERAPGTDGERRRVPQGGAAAVRPRTGAHPRARSAPPRRRSGDAPHRPGSALAADGDVGGTRLGAVDDQSVWEDVLRRYALLQLTWVAGLDRLLEARLPRPPPRGPSKGDRADARRPAAVRAPRRSDRRGAQGPARSARESRGGDRSARLAGRPASRSLELPCQRRRVVP